MTLISFRSALLGGAFLAAAVGAAPANAAPISHVTTWTAGGGSTQAYAPNGGATLLSDALSVSQGTNQAILTGPISFIGDIITFTPEPLVVPVASSGSFAPVFTASWGTYTFTSTSGKYERSSLTDSIAFLFQGIFTDSTHVLATQPAKLSESFTQADAGGPIGFSASFATPSPEPATLAVLGVGLLGLAAARRRKV